MIRLGIRLVRHIRGPRRITFKHIRICLVMLGFWMLSMYGLKCSIDFQLSTPPEVPEEYWGRSSEPIRDTNITYRFFVGIGNEYIDDLNREIDRALTRPFASTIQTSSKKYGGLPYSYLTSILSYWRHSYNWTARQEKLNEYPQYMTDVQGLNIHHYWIRTPCPSKGAPLRPLLLVHGWPSSVAEFQSIIPKILEKRPDQKFTLQLVIPSLPGFGFSDSPTKPGFGPTQAAILLKNLMLKLGYQDFYVHGVGWGSVIATHLAIMYPQHVIGLHSTMCFPGPANAMFTLAQEYYYKVCRFIDSQFPSVLGFFPLYEHIHPIRPDTLAVALSDNPVGLLAFILDKFSTVGNPDDRFVDEGLGHSKYNIDEVLDNVMLYWVTNRITNGQRLFAEYFNRVNLEHRMDMYNVEVPVGCIRFFQDIIPHHSRIFVENRHKKILQFTEIKSGGHFAGFEVPEILSNDIWNFVNKMEKPMRVPTVELHPVEL